MISGPRAPKAADTKQLRHILEPELIKLALPWVANDNQACRSRQTCSSGQVVLDSFSRYRFSFVRCTIYSDLQCSLTVMPRQAAPDLRTHACFLIPSEYWQEKIELLFQVKIRALRHILFLSRGSKSTKSVLSVLNILIRSCHACCHAFVTDITRITIEKAIFQFFRASVSKRGQVLSP